MVLRCSQLEELPGKVAEKGSLAPSPPCVLIAGNDMKCGDKGVCQSEEGSWHVDRDRRALATPAGVRDRRAHLDAARQDGKTGGDSLPGISFI